MTGAGQVITVGSVAVVVVASVLSLLVVQALARGGGSDRAVVAGDVFEKPHVVKVVDPDTFDIEVRGQVERIRPTLLDGVERGHRDFERGRMELVRLLSGARDLRIEVVRLDRWTWGTPRRPRLIARVTAQFPEVVHLNSNARVPLGVAMVGLAMMDAEARGRMPWAIPYVPALRGVWKGLKK